MTPEEKELLLTVARVLRAKVEDDIYAAQQDDMWALDVALAPFGPSRIPGGDDAGLPTAADVRGILKD